MEEKIRGAEAAWLRFVAHDANGGWHTVTGATRTLKTKRRNVQNYVAEWAASARIEWRHEGGWNRQFRRIIAGRAETAPESVPTRDLDHAGVDFRAVAIEHGPEIIRRTREIANGDNPRAALKALALLTEIGVGAVPSEDEIADDAPAEPDHLPAVVVPDPAQPSIFDFSVEEIDEMIAKCEAMI